jgi:hypothetical protein
MKLASSQSLKSATKTWIVTQTAVKKKLLAEQKRAAEQNKIAVEQGNATVEQKEVGYSPTCLIIDSCLIILSFRLMTIAKVNLKVKKIVEYYKETRENFQVTPSRAPARSPSPLTGYSTSRGTKARYKARSKISRAPTHSAS